MPLIIEPIAKRLTYETCVQWHMSNRKIKKLKLRKREKERKYRIDLVSLP